MQHAINTAPGRSLHFAGEDLEIRAQIGQQSLTIDVLKSGARVHRVTINGALGRLEHGWIADLFAGEHSVDLAAIVRDADDYVDSLDIKQG